MSEFYPGTWLPRVDTASQFFLQLEWRVVASSQALPHPPSSFTSYLKYEQVVRQSLTRLMKRMTVDARAVKIKQPGLLRP